MNVYLKTSQKRGVLMLLYSFLHLAWVTPRGRYGKTHVLFLEQTPPHRVTPLNMDITGHFESASCVIEVDKSDTLAQVKGKLLAELGVPPARHVGVQMRGGGDIGDDDLRICDTQIDEGCAVELYCTGANITPGLIQTSHTTYSLTLSPCDRYLAVVPCRLGVLSIFDTATHERLCHFPATVSSTPAFSPCSEWISCVNEDMDAEVHHVKTGALAQSFGEGDVMRNATAWSPCGTKLLACCINKGLQVWDIATGVVVHEWGHIVECNCVMVVTGDRVAMFAKESVTVWDYTTGVEVLVLTCRYGVDFMALSPNQRFIAACCSSYVHVWNIETGECVFEDGSGSYWADVAVSNDIVAAYAGTLCVWSMSTGEQLLLREIENNGSYGVAISSCGGVVMYCRNEGVEIVDISHLS